jgi:signal transduction histidine kinase
MFALGLVISSLVVLVYLPEEALPGDAWLLGLIILAINAIPAAIGIAVLRYRLYDIDVVINRSVLFVLLAGFITGVYALIVVGLGRAVGSQNNLALAVVATAVIAVAFEPVRLRAQRWADRVAYGQRATPYEVLSDLTERLSTAESTQGLLERTAQLLAEGTGAERTRVWGTDGSTVSLLGEWPAGEGAPPTVWGDLPGTVVEIEADGAPLGALTVEKRRGDPISSTEAKLIKDLAGSTAPLLKNLGLQTLLEAKAADLQASRRRLVEVQAGERRRLERDLDEGAQQLVVALKVKLNVAARLARLEEADALAVMLEGMDQEAKIAINQIRSLARGLYPQLLEEQGLAAAVRSLAESAPTPVQVETDNLGRLPADLETTAYFVISEAITNAAKHAPGHQVQVVIARQAESLVFTVKDQGPGFDPAKVARGSGLGNMADRLDAVGGRLRIDSSSAGTSVRGMVPSQDLMSTGLG